MLIFAISAMESSKGEESGKMYSPDEQGEYAPEAAMPKGVPHFSVQGLVDALTTEISNVQLLPSIAQVCLAAQGDDGRSPGVTLPPIILVECGHGHAHTQE